METALARLNADATTLAERFGVEVPEIPTTYMEAAELPAMQLEAMSDFLHALVENLPEEPVDYSAWTKIRLMNEFARRELRLDAVKGTGKDGNVLVEDLRAALIADDEAKAEKAEQDETP